MQKSCTDFIPWWWAHHFELHYFDNYLEILIQTTREQNLAFESEVRGYDAELAKTTSTEDRDLLIDSYINHKDLHEVTIQLQMRAFLVSIFSQVEYVLKSYCEHLRNKHHINFSVEDINPKSKGGQHIRYIVIATKEEFPINERLAQEVQILREVRNAVVHRDGLITEGFRQRIKSHDLLTIDKENKILLNLEYLKSILKISINLHRELIARCDKMV